MIKIIILLAIAYIAYVVYCKIRCYQLDQQIKELDKIADEIAKKNNSRNN